MISLLLLFFKPNAQTPVLKVADSILMTGNYQLALLHLEGGKKHSYKVLEKIALQYFEKHIENFSEKDKKSTIYAKQRRKEIRTLLFMNGEKVD